MEAACAAYPDPVREDALWLAGYLRERCARNLTALMKRINELGWPNLVDTTVSKIVRGKLFDSVGTPVLKLKTFTEVIEALRKLDYRESMAGQVPFIETSTWEGIRDYIDSKSMPDTICRFGLIIGPTGAQKTACLRHYQQLNNHHRTVHMEAPEKPTMGRFITKLAKCYGVSEWHNMEKKRLRITDNVNRHSILIVDNVQRMYVEKAGWNQPIFSFLQQLQDDTGCTVILCCVPEFELTLDKNMNGRGYFEQFEGRVGGRGEFHLLPDYAPEEDILAIARAFHLVDAEKHVGALGKLASKRGRIRILFNALQKGQRRAHNAKRPLTIEIVTEAAGLEI